MVNLTNQNEDTFMGSYSQDDVAHDAMAAHALMMAATEHDPDSDYRFSVEWTDVMRRADELMREWGFGED